MLSYFLFLSFSRWNLYMEYFFRPLKVSTTEIEREITIPKRELHRIPLGSKYELIYFFFFYVGSNCIYEKINHKRTYL
jgi:hypothetical protein